MIHHHRSDVMFKGNAAIPLDSGSLNWLFQPRFRSIDIAGLVPLLWSRFGSGSYSKVVSTLVNVCSPFSGFSTGYLANPPDRACSLGSHLLFTFSIKYDKSIDLDSLQVNMTSSKSKVWGSGKDDRKFITIGISSVEAANLGLLHVQANEINYVYRILGIIFRSMFMHYDNGDIDELKRGVDVHPDQDSPYEYKDSYLLASLTSIVRFPYWAWRYNLNLWQVAPNVIPYKDVRPELALYYFLFISQHVNPNVSTDDGLSKLLGIVPGQEGGILSVVKSSLMSFTQYLNNSSDYQFELLDLVAANALASLIYSGKSKIVLNKRNYLLDLESNTVALAEQLKRQLTPIELSQAMSPYYDTARSITTGDKTLSNKLLSGLSV